MTSNGYKILTVASILVIVLLMVYAAGFRSPPPLKNQFL
jgi:hypothetical protein